MRPFQWKWNEKTTYDELPGSSDDESIEEAQANPSLRAKIMLMGVLLLSCVLLVLGVFGLRQFSEHSGASFPAVDTQPCGNTSMLARARGCTFDILTSLWLPPHCPRYESDNYARYLEENELYYWDNEEGEGQPLTFTELSNLPKDVLYYNNRVYHAAHCVYMLLRQQRVRAKGEKMDSLTGDQGHTKHCLDYLLLSVNNTHAGGGKTGAKANIGFGYC